ncbi:Acyl carrier protein [Actinokineospora alba]|uniref:Acyl carrier protein n=1 Tax=Actinokineospora alba TaxID=504798 RepID=A0A1H0FD68_9PSEU|nr:phosphopantetheine-binding protein [Actinokineospora alba]TDP69433.1 acyl carrier protein [Actinokineospora alba]SDI16889.1 Acyl carrier protein [Actinokineospora alba]SDN92585.1 Acyl carrier protein [Actinokineospora alba]
MSTTRETVAQIWSDVLATPVDEESDFFLLGGHSLLATQMVARLEGALGVRVSMREVLDYAEFAEFADLVEQRLAVAG